MPTDTTTATLAPPTGPALDPPAPPRPGSSRHAWRALGAVLVLAALCWGTVNVISLLAHEEHIEVTTYDDTVGTIRVVDVATANGSVTVTGSPDAAGISVTADISEGLRDTGERQTVVGDRLELRGTCPAIGGDWCRVSYTVVVPSDVDVVVSSDSGRISVGGVDGSVDANADDGSLDVNDLGGDLTLQNDSGRIEGRGLRSSIVEADADDGRIVLEFVESPTSVVARTDSGSVEVVVPDNGDAYRLDISSGDGPVHDDDFLVDPDSERSITIRSDDGSVTARRATG